MEEGGHRVPIIARWPGVIPSDCTSDAVAMTMDFFPTFSRLAGVTLPRNHKIDGADLMPVSQRKQTGQGLQPKTLVNLADDRDDTNNHRREHPDRISSLLKLHEQWVDEVGTR